MYTLYVCKEKSKKVKKINQYQYIFLIIHGIQCRKYATKLY